MTNFGGVPQFSGKQKHMHSLFLYEYALLSTTKVTILWQTIIQHGGCCLFVSVVYLVSRGKLCYFATLEHFELEG